MELVSCASEKNRYRRQSVKACYVVSLVCCIIFASAPAEFSHQPFRPGGNCCHPGPTVCPPPPPASGPAI